MQYSNLYSFILCVALIGLCLSTTTRIHGSVIDDWIESVHDIQQSSMSDDMKNRVAGNVVSVPPPYRPIDVTQWPMKNNATNRYLNDVLGGYRFCRLPSPRNLRSTTFTIGFSNATKTIFGLSTERERQVPSALVLSPFTVYEYSNADGQWEEYAQASRGQEKPKSRKRAISCFNEKQDMFYVYGGESSATQFTETWGFSVPDKNWTKLSDEAPEGGEAVVMTAYLGYTILVTQNRTLAFNTESNTWDVIADNPVYITKNITHSVSLTYYPIENALLLFNQFDSTIYALAAVSTSEMEWRIVADYYENPTQYKPIPRIYNSIYYDYNMGSLVITPGAPAYPKPKMVQSDGGTAYNIFNITGVPTASINVIDWRPYHTYTYNFTTNEWKVQIYGTLAGNYQKVQAAVYDADNNEQFFVTDAGGNQKMVFISRKKGSICFAPYASKLSAKWFKIFGYATAGLAGVMFIVSCIVMIILLVRHKSMKYKQLFDEEPTETELATNANPPQQTDKPVQQIQTDDQNQKQKQDQEAEEIPPAKKQGTSKWLLLFKNPNIVLTLFLQYYNVAVFSAQYGIMFVLCYFLFPESPEFYYDSVGLIMVCCCSPLTLHITHTLASQDSATKTAYKSCLIYLQTIFLIPLYVNVLYFILAKYFFEKSAETQTPTVDDQTFYSNWKTNICGVKIQAMLAGLIIPIILPIVVMVLYYMIIDYRMSLIAKSSIGRSILKAVIFTGTEKFCEFLAAFLFDNVFKPGTSWYQLNNMIFASVSNSLNFFITIFVLQIVLGAMGYLDYVSMRMIIQDWHVTLLMDAAISEGMCWLSSILGLVQEFIAPEEKQGTVFTVIRFVFGILTAQNRREFDYGSQWSAFYFAGRTALLFCFLSPLLLLTASAVAIICSVSYILRNSFFAPTVVYSPAIGTALVRNQLSLFIPMRITMYISLIYLLAFMAPSTTSVVFIIAPFLCLAEVLVTLGTRAINLCVYISAKNKADDYFSAMMDLYYEPVFWFGVRIFGFMSGHRNAVVNQPPQQPFNFQMGGPPPMMNQIPVNNNNGAVFIQSGTSTVQTVTITNGVQPPIVQQQYPQYSGPQVTVQQQYYPPQNQQQYRPPPQQNYVQQPYYPPQQNYVPPQNQQQYRPPPPPQYNQPVVTVQRTNYPSQQYSYPQQ